MPAGEPPPPAPRPSPSTSSSSSRFSVPSFREVEARENDGAAARQELQRRRQLESFQAQRGRREPTVAPPADLSPPAAVARDGTPSAGPRPSSLPVHASGAGAAGPFGPGNVFGFDSAAASAAAASVGGTTSATGGDGAGDGTTSATRGTPPPPVARSHRRNAPNAIIVNPRQRGNPILASVRNVPYEYGEVVPDYVVGQTSCALFLSLKYHRLHPDYILDRVTDLGSMYVLRILLCLVDVDNHQEPLCELNRLCVQAGLVLFLAWSNEEAGRYLETFKSFEHKPPDMIRERVDEKEGYLGRLAAVLTSVKSVNKTDVVTLASHFGSLRRIVNAPREELVFCPGFGEQKVRRLQEAFEEPFVMSKKRRKAQERLQRARTGAGDVDVPAGAVEASRAGPAKVAREDGGSAGGR